MGYFHFIFINILFTTCSKEAGHISVFEYKLYVVYSLSSHHIKHCTKQCTAQSMPTSVI